MLYFFIFKVAGVDYEINWIKSMNACNSDRAACTIKVIIKETIPRNQSFLKTFRW